MKLSAEKRKEAKEMNAKYSLFVVHFYEYGIESKYYSSFGRAYQAANHYASRGMWNSLHGIRFEGCEFFQDELYAC